MSEKDMQEKTSKTSEELPSLQGRPQRRSNRKPSIPALIVVLVVILGVISFVVWQLVFQPGSNGSAGQPSGSGDGKGGVSVPVTPAYWETLQNEMAQGLHLPLAQVQTKLRSATNNGTNLSGSAIANIASGQGLSLDQLHSLELQALQKASDKLGSTHVWTQAQVNDNMSRWRGKEPSALNASFEEWLLGI